MFSSKPWTQLTPKEIDAWRTARWKARTDLGWFCRNVLGYPDVSDNNYQPGTRTEKGDGPHLPIHQPLIDTVQKFPVPTKEQMEKHDKFINGKWHYTPIMTMNRLPGKRRTLILDARSFLKTTVNTMAHSLQWVVNYPDVAIMVIQSNGAKAETFISEIKDHFTSNIKFRELFPEHVPHKNINDFGTRQYFTTLARTPGKIRREPTILASSIDKGMAGYHFDVIKCSDIVDPSNINGQGLQDVKRSFYYLPPLLIAPSYWIDVEGTRYHSDDTYGDIIDKEMRELPENRQYNMYIRSCYQRDVPAGRKQTYNIEDLKLPFKKGPDGKPLSWWPERFSTAHYERMKTDDPFVFATQQLNDPAAAAGAKVFGKPIRYISRQTFNTIPIAYKEIVIDTAETISKRADYTVLTVVSWDNTYGRMYVDEIHRDRFMVNEWMEILLGRNGLVARHRPLRIKIEETGFVRGLEGSIKREFDKSKRLYNLPELTLDMIKRDNQQGKTERIQNTLQSPYMNDDIIFLQDINRWCRKHNPLYLIEPKCNCTTDALGKELDDFPFPKTDDILDTLADAYQGKKYFGRMTERLSPKEINHAMKQAMTKLLLYGLLPGEEREAGNDGYYL